MTVNRRPNNSFARSLRLLFNRRFGTFWFASLLSNIGTWAQMVVQPWLLLNLGASSFLLGCDTFAMGAPVFLLTVYGGALADRADRRQVIGVFQSVQMLCPTLVVALLIAGIVRPWMVITLSLVIGVTDALSMPSFQTIVSSIVKREDLATGIALNTTQFNLSRILGPALAGALMASVGALGAFAVSAASYIPFILVALWILPRSGTRAPLRSELHHSRLIADLGAIARTSDLRAALLTVLTTSLLCAPLITFCPVLVKHALHGNMADFSIAMGAFGLGGLLGAVALLGVDERRDRRRLASWLAAAYGTVVVLAAVDPWLWALPVLLVAAGAAMTASNATANGVLQVGAPPHLLGQSISLYMLAMRGGAAIGGLVSGITVSAMGVRSALIVDGGLAVLLQIAIARGRRDGARPFGGSFGTVSKVLP